jgi:hypothetical protein
MFTYRDHMWSVILTDCTRFLSVFIFKVKFEIHWTWTERQREKDAIMIVFNCFLLVFSHVK